MGGRGTAGVIARLNLVLLCWVSRHFNASPALKIGQDRGFASVSLLPGEASLQLLAGVVSPSANMVENITQPPIYLCDLLSILCVSSLGLLYRVP